MTPLNNSFRRFDKKAVALFALACAGSTLLGATASESFAQSKPKANTATTDFFGTEPWTAQRVVLLLPVELGPGWNLDKAKTAKLMPAVEAKMQLALQRTGKFSTTQLHRYNPIILRGVQEKLFTKEQADALIAAPTLAGVQAALAPMRFEQPPLIAQVTLDEAIVEVGAPSPNLVATVTGRLYEANDPQAIREVIVTSNRVPLYLPQKRKGKQVLVRRSPNERLMLAADNAFNQVARDFVKPIEEITLPVPVRMTPTGPVPGGPVLGGTIPGSGAPTIIRVPRGQVLGTFTIPVTPAPK